MLIEAVVERQNVSKAYTNVVCENNPPGVDGMTVENLGDWMRSGWFETKKELLEGCYEPKPVLYIEFSSRSSGVRHAGLPTVVDRLVQHALRLVLEPIFRDDSSLVLGDTPPNKSRSLIPLDLGKFLDETRHELLLTNIARTVKDKNVLDLIQRILRAQCIKDGIAMQRWKGTLLGEPLSALFTRILLDALDRELEKRGLAFSRYPQDSAILLAGEHATLPARSMAYRIA